MGTIARFAFSGNHTNKICFHIAIWTVQTVSGDIAAFVTGALNAILDYAVALKVWAARGVNL